MFSEPESRSRSVNWMWKWFTIVLKPGTGLNWSLLVNAMTAWRVAGAASGLR